MASNMDSVTETSEGTALPISSTIARVEEMIAQETPGPNLFPPNPPLSPQSPLTP